MTPMAQLAIDRPHKRIGIAAAHIAPGLERLLAALEAAFPVTFARVPRAQLADLDAIVVLEPARLLDTAARIPRLMVPQGGRSQRELAQVALADDARVHVALRGRVIREDGGTG